MSNVNFVEIQEATSHLIPKHPQPHEAGLQGAAYAVFAIVLYWIVTAVGAPPVAAAFIVFLAFYFVGRQDGKVAWKRYENAYAEMVAEQIS